MKFLVLLFASALFLNADPLTTSWFTELSGRYARIYPDNEAMAAQAPVTTWNRGDGVQDQPVYAGITEISSTNTDVYIRTSKHRCVYPHLESRLPHHGSLVWGG